MTSNGELLPSPLRAKKAPRDRHPSEPSAASAPSTDTPTTPTPAAAAAAGAAGVTQVTPAATPPPPPASSSRVGPNRVRKSLYMAADVAQELTTLTDAIHYDSRGAISKADAAGELIRRGLTHVDEVYKALGVRRPSR